MLQPGLAITGIGMATSLGGAATACAAARAGMSRARALQFCVEDKAELELVPLVGHPVGDCTLGFAEVGLSIRLASLGLADLLESVPLTPADMSSCAAIFNLPSAFYFQHADEAEAAALKQAGMKPSLPEVGTPPSRAEGYEATKPLYVNRLINNAFQHVGLPAPPLGKQQLFFTDQSGMGHAIMAAHRLLTSRTVTSCLVGGIDSLLEPRWLRCLLGLGLVKTPVCPVGLMPGEAAVFLLLERQGQTRNRPTLAVIGACEIGKEAMHRFADRPSDGRAYAEVISRCLPPDDKRTGIISDLNGDDVRASEFGAVFVLLKNRLEPPQTILPAISFGDTRAASGFLGIGVAVRAFARNYAESNRFVVCSAGDDGGRAAVLIQSPAT